MTVHVVSGGLSVLDSLRDPGRCMPGDSELARVIIQERPEEMLARAGAAACMAAASAWPGPVPG